jgi:hypothetical protein
MDYVEKQRAQAAEQQRQEKNRQEQVAKARLEQQRAEEAKAAEEKRRRDFMNTPEGKRQMAAEKLENEKRLAENLRQKSLMKYSTVFSCSNHYGQGESLARYLIDSYATESAYIFVRRLDAVSSHCSSIIMPVADKRKLFESGVLVKQINGRDYYVFNINESLIVGIVGRN